MSRPVSQFHGRDNTQTQVCLLLGSLLHFKVRISKGCRIARTSPKEELCVLEEVLLREGWGGAEHRAGRAPRTEDTGVWPRSPFQEGLWPAAVNCSRSA